MGRPGRLAEAARPCAGCAMRDSDKWDRGRPRGERAGRGARVAGSDDGQGSGRVKEHSEHNANNLPGRGKSPGHGLSC